MAEARTRQVVTAVDWPETAAIVIGIIVVAFVRQGLILLPVGVVAIAAERALTWRQQRIIRPGWRTDLCYALLTNSLAGMVAAVVTLNGAAALHGVLGPARAAVSAQPAALLLIECALVTDLIAYVQHRLSHEIPLLWRFHAVHHSSEELDWMSSQRSHPVEASWMIATQMLPVYAMGVPIGIIAIWRICVLMAGPWSHANVTLGMGRLWWLVASPPYHRWHHSRERRPANSNYAIVLPIWDILFRTVYLPRGRVVGRFGLPYAFPTGYLDQLTAPFLPAAQQPVDTVKEPA